jgi:uncharacterized Tic20 family protein
MPPESPADPSSDARRNAALSHLSAAAGLVVPLGTVVGPLVAWLVFREGDPFTERQARHAVDVNLAFLVLELVLGALLISSALLGVGPGHGFAFGGLAVVVGIGIVGLVHAGVVLYAALKASDGEDVRIPFRLPVLGP